MNLSALIVDDERRGRELLQHLLALHCLEVSHILTASSLDEAQALLQTFVPDILFLDIRLGADFGLDLIAYLPQPIPYIIVTTAHEEFAIKAIRAKVLDYLLKPIIADELVAAVKKVIDVRFKQLPLEPPATHNKPIGPDRKIAVPTTEGFVFIQIKSIIHCKAEGAYTRLYVKENDSILVSSNLGEMEKLLPETLGFFRIHHASLVNVYEIVKYIKSEGGYVIMSDQSRLVIAQRKKSQFLQFIKQLG